MTADEVAAWLGANLPALADQLRPHVADLGAYPFADPDYWAGSSLRAHER